MIHDYNVNLVKNKFRNRNIYTYREFLISKYQLTDGTVTEPKIFLKTTSVRPIITSSVAHSTTLAASPATKAMSTGGFIKHQNRNNSPRDDVEALT